MDTVDEKQLRKAYMQKFPDGDIVLMDLQNRCFKYSTTQPIPGAQTQGETIEINEGKRQMLLHIENMRSPKGFAKLAEEPEKGSE